MKIRVTYTVPDDIIPTLIGYARQIGLDYGRPDQKTILRRLYARLGQAAERDAFEVELDCGDQDEGTGR